MKKLLNIKTVSIILLCLFVSLSSCNQDMTTPAPSVEDDMGYKEEKIEKLDLQGVWVEDGILHFESLEALDKTTELLKKSNFESYKAWAESHNFKSLSLLKYEFNEKLSKIATQENMVALTSKYSDIIGLLPDSSFALINPHANLHGFLNHENMVFIGSSLCKYDKNNTIIVFDGDKEKLKKAVANQVTVKEQGIFVLKNDSNRLQTRAACSDVNDSGLQYGDPGRRAKVVFAQIWQAIPNNFTVDFKCILNVSTFAQKRTLGVYFDYSTEQTLKFQTHIFVPTPIRGSNSSQTFFVDLINNPPLRGVTQSLSYIQTLKEFNFVQNYEVLNVKSQFLDIDYFYSNRGGVNFEFHCF